MSNNKNLDERVKMAALIFCEPDYLRKDFTEPFQVDEFYSSSNGHCLFAYKKALSERRLESETTHRFTLDYIHALNSERIRKIGYISTDETYKLITILTGGFNYIENKYKEEIKIALAKDIFSSDIILDVLDAAMTVGATNIMVSYDPHTSYYYFSFSDDMFVIALPLHNEDKKFKSDLKIPTCPYNTTDKQSLPPLNDTLANKWIQSKETEASRQKKEYEKGCKFYTIQVVKYDWVQVYAHDEMEAKRLAVEYGDSAADFLESEIEIESEPEELYSSDINTDRSSMIIDSDGSHFAKEWMKDFHKKKKK